MARQAKQSGVVFDVTSKAMPRGLLWGITLRFHHHTPEQPLIRLASDQVAAYEFRYGNFRLTAKEDAKQYWEIAWDGLGGWWS